MPTPPVLFIPGLGGSFNLSVLLDWRGPTLNGWRFPPFVDYGDAFLEAFRRAGYRRNRDLFVAFYDWRKPVEETARVYLVPWINRARRSSASEKVILIGHSMGGLVARSYIQSNEYRGDVDRLITLGTPHRGSANAYRVWQGGELEWDPLMRVVLNVYLWYLEHIHPFQSRLDRLKTIRTQVPGARDLLPIDDYLLSQEDPPRFKPEAHMDQRNLSGHMLNTSQKVETLVGHVSVSTINSQGFLTTESIVVSDPPPPTHDPPRFPDGTPEKDVQTGRGDGTVLLRSAEIDHPQVRNLPPTQIAHADLADLAVEQVLAELGVTVDRLPAAPAKQPRLVIMTASPLQVTVELPFREPETQAGVLGAYGTTTPSRRRASMRTYSLGHAGKPLSLTVVERPPMGTYTLRLRGTGTGYFELGSLFIGVAAPATGVLGAAQGTAASEAHLFATPPVTVEGEVAPYTELHYQIHCHSVTEPPQISFDSVATAHNLLTRLRDVVRTPPPGVLGAAAEPPATAQVETVLAAVEAPEAMRQQLNAALTADDETATREVTATISNPERPESMLPLLNQITGQLIGQRDLTLALGLAQQIKQIERHS